MFCSDGKEFYHWQRADLQQNDYPYAKFNVKTESIRYTDDEYNNLLVSPKWSRSETDYLMFVCSKYDLRWPVITDRYSFVPARPTEDIQERYFDVITKLNTRRTNPNPPTASAVGSSSSSSGTSNETGVKYDSVYEKERRKQQDSVLRT